MSAEQSIREKLQIRAMAEQERRNRLAGDPPPDEPGMRAPHRVAQAPPPDEPRPVGALAALMGQAHHVLRLAEDLCLDAGNARCSLLGTAPQALPAASDKSNGSFAVEMNSTLEYLEDMVQSALADVRAIKEALEGAS